MSNLDIYERVRAVPPEAQREIAAGRLRGKTDINPMWRIKTLTEVFGPCGIGWKTVIKKKWLEQGANGEVISCVDIDLFVRDSASGEWSEAIPGTGGSMFISSEKNGLYTDDDAYKKAYTDAISVACKLLGMGADVYWDKDPTKYDMNDLGDKDNGDKSDNEGDPEEPLPSFEEAIMVATEKGSKLCELTNEQLELVTRVRNNKDLALAAKAILKHRIEFGAV